MTVGFGAPWALAGLAALVLPVLLHLQRRRTPRPLPFAALRWLGRARPARRTPRLVERALLALRLLLVAAAVLWCAAPRLEGWRAAPREVVLVVPGAGGATPRGPAQEAYWLASGFPPLSTPMPAAGATASLLREFDASLAPQDHLSIVVPRELDGLDAQALVLGRTVQWRVVDGATRDTVAEAPGVRVLAVRHSSPDEPALAYVRAALAAWDAASPGTVRADVAPAGAPLPARVDAILWFGGAPDAAVLSHVRGGAALLEVPDAQSADPASSDGEALGPRQREGRGWRRRSLVPWQPTLYPALLDATFPDVLREWLFGPPPAPSRAYAATVEPAPGAAAISPPRPLRPWLTWLIAALFLLERTWANGPRLARPA